MKRHVRADGKNPFAMRAQVHQANAGDDLMCATLKFRQHLFRFIKITRLAKNFTFQKNQRVCTQHERVWNFLCDGARLAMRVDLAEFTRRQVFIRNFHRIARHNFKFQFQLPQQFRASR